MRSYKLRTARKHVSPEERKTYIENGTLPSSILTHSYNAGGLVTQVKKNNVPLVKFFYNDRNHRLKKETYGGTNGDKILSTHYVRDVGGQVMAIYNEPQNGTPKVTEHPVYGSGRIGVYKPGGTPKTLYELTDHLGNLRTVFSVTDTNSGLINEGYSDYYPFGMPMPGRNMVGDYRYAFQGQEKDPETGKEAFELRLWDGRIGRWLTTDPAGQYTSPYLGMGNNPINGIDPDGGCFTTDKDGNTTPCADSGLGSTMTGVAGYEWTMGTDGWDRSDGYGFTGTLALSLANFQNPSYGKEFLNGAILLYGISEGATGTIQDFDKVTEALRNDTFLSRELHNSGELRPYKLNPDGSAAYKGGGRGKVNPEDVTKAANKFKTKANIIKGVNALGVATNVVGVGLSVHQIYVDGELNLFNGMDTAMGLVAFVPGVGWVASGSYSIMSITTPKDYRTSISPTFERFGE